MRVHDAFLWTPQEFYRAVNFYAQSVPAKVCCNSGTVVLTHAIHAAHTSSYESVGVQYNSSYLFNFRFTMSSEQGNIDGNIFAKNMHSGVRSGACGS